MIALKRAYEPAAKADGFRILVDRLWPRGLAKDKVRIDLWLRDIAPSDALRQWFGHQPEHWPEFERRYREELRRHADLMADIRRLEAEHGTVTLIFSARDEERNNAVVLQDVLRTG